VLKARAIARALTLATCALSLYWPAATLGSQVVELHARFSPDRLGASTTMYIGFKIAAPAGGVPPPLTNVDLHFPRGMGLVGTTLGLANCFPGPLLARGISGCSPNARIGIGSALVEVPFGPVIVHESVTVNTFIGPPNRENLELLYYVEGWTPVASQLVFAGHLLPDRGLYGEHVDTQIPLTPSLPGAPDAAVVGFETTVGARGLTYVRRAGKRIVRYRPQGMIEPRTCPRGGFPFRGEFSFVDGTHSTATTVASCPDTHVGRPGTHVGRYG
jgi:hypothetical protein